MTTTFNAKYLRSLLPFVAGKDDPRPYLKGIRIEPHPDGGAILIAVNGHVMMLIRDVAAQCTAHITIKVRPEAARYNHKRHIDVLVTVDDETGRLIVADGAGELYVQPNDCRMPTNPMKDFPDWRKVVPKISDLKGIDSPDREGINLHYLGLLNKGAPYKSLHPEQLGVRFWQSAPTGIHVVEYLDFPEYMTCIMPFRIRGGSTIAKWTEFYSSILEAAKS